MFHLRFAESGDFIKSPCLVAPLLQATQDSRIRGGQDDDPSALQIPEHLPVEAMMRVGTISQHEVPIKK